MSNFNEVIEFMDAGGAYFCYKDDVGLPVHRVEMLGCTSTSQMSANVALADLKIQIAHIRSAAELRMLEEIV